MGAEESKPAPPPGSSAPTSAPAVSNGADKLQAGPGDAQANLPSALVIVGPSGVGKGTLIKRLMEMEPDKFGFSVSHTTRQPRPGEKHGVDYHFTSKELFAKEVAEGKFLEWAEVHSNLYGTTIAAVRSVLQTGRVCVLDIDVQGARAVRASPLRAIFVFVAPPSLEDLAQRLGGRGTESVEQITHRLNNAKAEIESLNEQGLYDYLLINDDLEETVGKLRGIAARAAAGLPAEPGMVPERVVLEDAPLPEIVLKASLDQAHPTSSDNLQPTEDPTGLPPHPTYTNTLPTAASALPASNSNLSSNTASAGATPTGRDGGTAGSIPPPPPPSAATTPTVSSSAAAAVPFPATTAAAAPSALRSSVGSGSSGPLLASSAAGLSAWVGRVALVTGASSGIGWATCEALATAGMRVVAVARRRERLEELQRHIHSLGVAPLAFLPVVCDITKDTEVATLPKIVAKRWPESGIDVLVNNAGVSRSDASLCEGNVASWVEMLSTNVLGTCMCTKAVFADMKRRQRYGHIINLIGLSGHRIPDGPTGGSFYAATKSAVKTLTEGLRLEARGQHLPLRVSGISPGIVETEFFTVRAFGDTEAAKKATSQFKCLQPQDIAQAVLWCLAAPPHMEVNDIVIRPVEQLI